MTIGNIIVRISQGGQRRYIMDEKKTNFKREIKQSKELPRFRYKLGLNEQKLLLCLFGQLKQNSDAFVAEEIPVEDITNYCGFEDANNRRLIRSTIKDLNGSGLEYYNDDEDYGFISWFSYIKRKGDKILYQLNNAIKSELLQLYQNNKIYITIDPLLLPKFHTNYGLRFYLILKGELASHRTEVTYSVEELCSIMMLTSSYNPKETTNASANQRVKIIDPAVEEINNVSNINVSYVPVKESRRIVGWRFKLEQKETLAPSSQIPLPQLEEPLASEWYDDKRVKNAVKELVTYGFERAMFPKIRKKFSNAEDFLKAAEVAKGSLTKLRMQGEDIPNPGGLLYRAIDEYDPKLTMLFKEIDEDLQEQVAQAKNETTKINNILENAKNWKDITNLVSTQNNKKDAIELLQKAAEERKDLLEKYQKAYSLTYPNEPKYTIETEKGRISLYGAEELRNTLRVNYELLDDK